MLSIPPPSFSGHQIVYFSGYYWLIAGKKNGVASSEVWRSSDGQDWALRTATAAFPERYDHQVVSFDGGLWLFAGAYLDGEQNEVYLGDLWWSVDGENWENKTITTASNETIAARAGHQMISFDNKIWLIGGMGTEFYNDVWSSDDGLAWQKHQAVLANDDPAFSKRSHFSLTKHNNKLWLIAGFDGTSYLNDVWSSADGLVWQPVTVTVKDHQDNSLSFPNVANHELVLWAAADQSNTLWLIGGQSSQAGSLQGYIWASQDGSDWVRQDRSTVAFSVRKDLQVIATDARLIIHGGQANNDILNDSWSSSDGSSWQQYTPFAEFSARHGHGITQLDDGTLLLAGGFDGSFRNDVWTSSDGIAWTLVTAKAGFSARVDHQLVNFNSKLWLVGGKDAADDALNDIWTSQDNGQSWSLENVSITGQGSTFPHRYGHQVLISKNPITGNKFWLTGGYDENHSPSSEVWASPGGNSWKLVDDMTDASDSSSLAIAGHAFIQDSNEMFWLVGGDKGGTLSNTLFNSSDARSWNKVTPIVAGGASFVSAQTDLQFISWNAASADHYLIVAKNQSSQAAEVLTSSDGTNWSKISSPAIPALSGHQLFYTDQVLSVAGKVGDKLINEVWSSADGDVWKKYVRTVIGFDDVIVAE